MIGRVEVGEGGRGGGVKFLRSRSLFARCDREVRGVGVGGGGGQTEVTNTR